MSVKRICYGCVPPDRHPGCHSECEKYREEREAALEKYERNLIEKRTGDLIRASMRNKTGLNRKMYIREARK